MSAVITFVHRGVAAAVPASQVIEVSKMTASIELERNMQPVQLWRGVREAQGHALRVQTADGECALLCEEVELRPLPESALMPLSPLLAGILRLSHVVGMAEIAGSLVFLVDLLHFRPSGPQNTPPKGTSAWP